MRTIATLSTIGISSVILAASAGCGPGDDCTVTATCPSGAGGEAQGGSGQGADPSVGGGPQGGGGTGGVGGTGAGGSAGGGTPALEPNHLAVGSSHGCVLDGPNELRCWGDNAHGEVGIGTTGGSFVDPVVVPNFGPATSIGAGFRFTCALLTSGVVECWGDPVDDSIGTYPEHNSPTIISGINSATQLKTGTGACALLGNGSVWCWGDTRTLGEQCITPNCGTTTPTQVQTGAALISGDGGSTCAVITGQGVWCWGQGMPAQANTLSGVEQLETASSFNQHRCARLDTGSIECWGTNSFGQLGNGGGGDSTVPVPVQGISTAVDLALGGSHSCALLEDRTVSCWGNGTSNQLGNGTMTSSSTPVAVMQLDGVVDIAASATHSCALRDDHSVWCWGEAFVAADTWTTPVQVAPP